jgi:hypothetical protein
MAQAVTPDFLLTIPPGWSTVNSTIVRQLPQAILPSVDLDGHEWLDANFLGIGATTANVQTAMQKFRPQIQMLGSDLYAYKLIMKTEVNFLGLRINRYRLILCHSGVPALILVGALLVVFAFVVFQYTTMGNSPLMDGLNKAWAGLVQATVTPIGQGVGQGLAWVMLPIGGLFLLYAVAGKKLGVEPAPPPKAHVEVKSGPVAAGVRT